MVFKSIGYFSNGIWNWFIDGDTICLGMANYTSCIDMHNIWCCVYSRRLLKFEGSDDMKVVVFKVPGMFGKFLKKIFKIKD